MRVALLALLFAPCAAAEPQIQAVLPDLSGTWLATTKSVLSLYRHQPSEGSAAVPNSVYARELDGKPLGHCWLAPSYDYNSRELQRIVFMCDGGDRGIVTTDSSGSGSSSSSTTTTPAVLLSMGGDVWRRNSLVPAPHNETIHTVHMIYMNHYDVGYTGYVNDVDNKYMHNYFPLAASTAKAMKANASDGGDRFIYTTHAWLMQRFLECPCPQPAPAAPCTAGLPGVWTGGDGRSRFYFSNPRDPAKAAGLLTVNCLTSDLEASPAGSCSWGSGKCTMLKGDYVSCDLDNGTTIAGAISAGSAGADAIAFGGSGGSGGWRKFTGPLSGLWYGCKRVVNGPNDPTQYLVIGHNASNGNVTVWWDTGIAASSASPPRQWTYSTDGALGPNRQLKLQLNGYLNGTYINGSVSPAYDSIQFPSNDESGIWRAHAAQCYPGPECGSGEALPGDCAARTLMNNRTRPVQCPTAAEVATFEEAVHSGDIVWHAAPFNWQPENMAPQLFEAGIDMVRRMDQRFYGGKKNTTTMSIRDVMYVTRSVVPYLAERGITGLTIGSNGADIPPSVPKLHRWVDKATGTDVIVAYHPYGYGGYGPTDCAESPNGVALCTEFRTDNTGPPTTTAEVQVSLNKLRSEYPGATIKTSTFDAFIKDVEPVKAQLPVVDLEVGDTWMYGSASDPIKMAINRGLQRVWAACLESGDHRCSYSDPTIQNFSWFLLKAPEHTWGTAGIDGIWGKDGTFDTTEMRNETLLNSDPYALAAAAWEEQMNFGELAVRVLEEAGHPLAKPARAEVDLIESVSAPDLTGYTEVPLETVVQFAGNSNGNGRSRRGIHVRFGTDGAITGLERDGTAWASLSAPLGAFTYKTLNDTDWMPFTYSYLAQHQPSPGFWKPGSNNFSESTVFRPTATKLFVKSDNTSAVVEMQMPARSSEKYGSWATIYLTVSVDPSQPGDLNLTYSTLGKSIVAIGESTAITFQPAPSLKPSAATGASAWSIDKLGHGVDPEGVQDGGNQFNHASWHGTSVATTAGSMTIKSLDAPNMNPMTRTFPIGNPLPASIDEALSKSGRGMAQLPKGSVVGMAVNLHNNLWNTNYPLYYPYYTKRYCASPLACSNANAIWRFTLAFDTMKG